MTYLLFGSIGFIVGGPVAATIGCVVLFAWSRWRTTSRETPPPPPLRLVLILLLVELRSGQSVLGALQRSAVALPEHRGLTRVARVAAVSGLTAAVTHSPNDLRPVVAQLARAQASGAALVSTVRRLLEDDLRDERSRRLEKAKSLPARLMVPVTLLMLPGVVLLVYGPSLVNLYQELFTTWP